MKIYTFYKNLLAITTLMVLFANSCKKDTTDFGKFDGYNPSPEFAIPLVNTKIGMQNLVNNDTINTRVDGNGLVHFIFRQPDIFKYSINDFFEFENNNNTNINSSMGEITIGNVNNAKLVTLGQLSTNFTPVAKAGFDAIQGTSTIFPSITENISTITSFDAFTEFSSVRFSDGWLVLKITNKLPVNLSSITLHLYNLTPTQTLIGTFTYNNIAPGGQKSDSISLIGKTLRSSLGYSLPVFNTNSSAPTAVLINYLDSITLTLSGRNLKAIGGEATFPSQNIISKNSEINFTPADTNQRIRKLNLASGKIKFIAQSTIKEPIELSINFPGALKNGVPLPSQIITIPYTGSGNNYYIDSSINIAKVDFDLTQNPNKPYNYVPISYSAKIKSSGLPVIFDSSDYIDLQILTTNTTVDYLEGYIGVIEIPTDNTDFINLSFLNDIQEGLNLEEPELRLTIKNSFGVPVRFAYNFLGKNNSGKTQDAQMIPFDANYPTISQQGQTINTLQVYSNANGNGKINELMSLPPHNIQIAGKITSNPIPNPNDNQFIKIGGQLAADLELDLPLALKTSNFVLSDSSDFDVTSFDGFKSVTIGLNIDNSFPFDANVKIVFRNKDSKKSIDSITVNKVVLSAITNADGKTIQSSKSRTRFELTEARLKKLIANKANEIKIYSTLITENNGTKKVKVYSDYDMKIAIGIIATIKP
ncbi:MAG: hypothetical protein ACEQSR_08400 [Candidatus Methylacidiphilales bacterium]